MTLRVVGVDPGFANVGLAAVDLHATTSIVLQVQHIRTKPSHKKQRLAVADDESQRLAEIEDSFRSFIGKWSPKIVSMEDPPWGKNAKAVKTCALMWGAIHGICRDRGIPVVNLSAQSIKRFLTGSNSASKEEVLAALKRQHPEYTDWLDTQAVEHVADAAGAALAARNSPVVYALVSTLGGALPARR